MIHPTIGWRQDKQGTQNMHTAHGFSDLYHVFAWNQCILGPALRHGCLTLLICYIDLRFFLALEQSRMALLGGCLAASRNYVHLWVGSLYVLQGKLIWFISWIGRDVITTIFSKILHVQMVVYSLIQGSWYSAMLQFCIILINWKLWLTANFRLSLKTLQKMYIKQPHLVQTDLISLSTVLPWIVGAAKTNEKCLWYFWPK